MDKGYCDFFYSGLSVKNCYAVSIMTRCLFHLAKTLGILINIFYLCAIVVAL